MKQVWYTEPFPLGVATGVVTTFIVAGIRRVAAIVREFSRPIVRIRWGTWLGVKLFRASRSVYSRVHPDLRDDFDELETWLAEQVETDKWQEIYLVARGFRRVRGVLYASLYPQYQSEAFRGPLCFVNCIVANSKLSDKQALRVGSKLWQQLVKEVCLKADQPREVCHFFFEVVQTGAEPEGGTLSIDDEKRRRRQYYEFLRSIGAKRVKLAYRFPDMEEYRQENEIEAHLAHKGPDVTMDSEEVLKFVYGFHYFWGFEYGSELTDISQLAGRIGYVRELMDRVRAKTSGTAATLEEL